eukprot:SAG11_NODE_15639_length_571_cov_0.868644_1_plen_107_part_01
MKLAEQAGLTVSQNSLSHDKSIAVLPDAATDDEIGVVSVRVISAAGLRDSDGRSKVDPYVSVHIQPIAGSSLSVHGKTSALSGNPNPVWSDNNSFELPVTSVSDLIC